MTRPRRLNLELPVTEPLSPEEQREMAEHLAFLRQFKPYLGLSLNATEDLLVNGVRPATDRGVCKHLLSKLDRRAVERALGREAVKTSPGLRARLLAGAVRINPDVANLLAYLEALTWVADKHEAAAAFGATIDRIDFGAISTTQMAGVLDVVHKTFEGQERIQALFGLLENETFRGALDRTVDALPEALRAEFAPLSAAHRAVLRGELPRDAAERVRAEQGVATWLNAQERVLRSYPIAVRLRLVQYALGDVDLGRIAKPIRILVDTLPREDPASGQLALALFDRLMVARQDDLARGLLNALLHAQPTLAGARGRQEMLSWPRKGRLVLMPESPTSDRLRRVYSFDLAGFVWVRIGQLKDALRLEEEADLQSSLLIPGVASCLGFGTGPDATPYVVLAPMNQACRQLNTSAARSLPLRDALALALQGIKILNAIAQTGVTLPDASLTRFGIERTGTRIELLDLDGVCRRPPDQCAAESADLIRALCRNVLGGNARGGLRRDVPKTIVELLAGRPAPSDLARELAVVLTRDWDGGTGVSPTPPEADPQSTTASAQTPPPTVEQEVAGSNPSEEAAAPTSPQVEGHSPSADHGPADSST